MAYKIKVSLNAEADLAGILDYLSNCLASPKAASVFADSVIECYGILENMPYIFEECRDGLLKMQKIRRAVIKNYVMLYEVLEDTKVVHIHHFFSGMQDYEKLV